MNLLMNLLQRLNLISNIIDVGTKIYDRFKKPTTTDLKPTTTDLILTALDVADRISFDMETVSLTLNAIIADDPDKEKPAKEKLKSKLVEYGFNPEIWDQFLIWHKNAEFGWTSFRDELKILVGERMTLEQKKDIVTYVNHDKNKHKVKIKI